MHLELNSVYVNITSNIFSVDTSCREYSCKLANEIDLNKVIGTGLKEENDKVTDISTSNVWQLVVSRRGLYFDNL